MFFGSRISLNRKKTDDMPPKNPTNMAKVFGLEPYLAS